MPGIRTQPASPLLRWGGGGGVRSSCREVGTRALLSSAGQSRAGIGGSFPPSLPLLSFLPPPVEALPLGAQPLQALGWRVLEGPGPEGLCSDPGHSGDSCQCVHRCVCGAEETVFLSGRPSWKPQGPPSVGLRLWPPRVALARGEPWGLQTWSLKAPMKSFSLMRTSMCTCSDSLLLLTTFTAPRPQAIITPVTPVTPGCCDSPLPGARPYSYSQLQPTGCFPLGRQRVPVSTLRGSHPSSAYSPPGLPPPKSSRQPTGPCMTCPVPSLPSPPPSLSLGHSAPDTRASLQRYPLPGVFFPRYPPGSCPHLLCVAPRMAAILFKPHSQDFPGGPVVKTPRFHCRGPRFDPWLGN